MCFSDFTIISRIGKDETSNSSCFLRRWFVSYTPDILDNLADL
jgi:hypothetical protein